MKLYRTFSTDEDLIVSWHGTRAEAHVAAKELPRGEARIELVDVPTDKQGLVAMLNGADQTAEECWRLTNRGAMVECLVGE